jgi:L-threonylcarbamoyladenylate synthase
VLDKHKQVFVYLRSTFIKHKRNVQDMIDKSHTLNMLSINEIADFVKQGMIGVIPTDTLYGVVCSAALPEAITRLYALKKRERKPGTVIAASIDQLAELGVPKRYLTAVQQFWPNPISVVIPLGDHLKELHAGKGSVAFRVPDNEQLISLLQRTGPLLTSSANHPGEQPAQVISEAEKYFGDEVDFYVDGGDLSSAKPSTVIRMVDDAVEVLREGAVTVTERGEIL